MKELEEQGRMIVLPCKVGDTVYVNGVLGCGEADEYKISKVIYKTAMYQKSEFYIKAIPGNSPEDTSSYIYFYDKDFGETVFLTREAAEAALKEE